MAGTCPEGHWPGSPCDTGHSRGCATSTRYCQRRRTTRALTDEGYSRRTLSVLSWACTPCEAGEHGERLRRYSRVWPPIRLFSTWLYSDFTASRFLASQVCGSFYHLCPYLLYDFVPSCYYPHKWISTYFLVSNLHFSQHSYAPSTTELHLTACYADRGPWTYSGWTCFSSLPPYFF